MYYAASGAWDCCPASRVSCLAMPVGCAGSNMVYRYSATGSVSATNSLFTLPWYVPHKIPSLAGYVLTCCSSSVYTGTANAPFSICNTLLVFENDRDANPKVGLGCGKGSKIWSYYRNPPAVATPGPSSSMNIPMLDENHCTDLNFQESSLLLHLHRLIVSLPLLPVLQSQPHQSSRSQMVLMVVRRGRVRAKHGSLVLSLGLSSASHSSA
jgi:hypothetical protein